MSDKAGSADLIEPKRPSFGRTLAYAVRLVRNPLRLLSDLRRDYGDIAHMCIGSRHQLYFLYNPDLVRDVLVGKAKSFSKGDLDLLVMKRVLGNGLFVSDGEVWQQQRQHMQRAFDQERLSTYVSIMARYTDEMLNSWEADKSFNICSEMYKLSARISAKLVLDLDLHDAPKGVADAITNVFRLIDRQFDGHARIPWPWKNPDTKDVDTLDQFIFELISDRRRSGKKHADMVSALVSSVGDDSSVLTDRQIRDEVITLLVAGQETTATALAWCFYLLAEHPHVQTRLRQEVENVLKGQVIDQQLVHGLSYCQMVLKETMRLYPPAWLLVRQALSDTEVGKFRIKRGGRIYISPYVIHRDEEYFENPHAFVPERFRKDEEEKLRPFTYIPFGAGPRTCVGRHLSMMEQTVVMATVLSRFEIFSGPRRRDIRLRPRLTLQPEGGVMVTVKHSKGHSKKGHSNMEIDESQCGARPQP